MNYVKTAIQKGELKVGDKLPREADIAQELNVGRSSLREGLKILHAYGVIEARQGEGTFVVDNRARTLVEFMSFVSSEENMHHFLGLRRILEVGNIVDLQGKMRLKDIEELERLNSVFFERGLPVQDYIDADKAFHNFMISFSRNPMLIQINNMIANLSEALLVRLFAEEKNICDVAEGHRKILEALKANDMEKSIEAIGSHLLL